MTKLDPAGPMLAASVTTLSRSCTYTSTVPFPSLGARSAAESNATTWPSPSSEGWEDELLPWLPSLATLARTVVPVVRSRTNTSPLKFVSPGTRLSEKDVKATRVPSPLIVPSLPLAWAPLLETLIRVVVPVSWSCRNTSDVPFVSRLTRLLASESKTTKRPSALIDGPAIRFRRPLSALPWRPALDTLTRSVVPVSRSRTKISDLPFVSPGTRLSDSDANATKRPSALTDGRSLS